MLHEKLPSPCRCLCSLIVDIDFSSVNENLTVLCILRSCPNLSAVLFLVSSPSTCCSTLAEPFLKLDISSIPLYSLVFYYKGPWNFIWYLSLWLSFFFFKYPPNYICRLELNPIDREMLMQDMASGKATIYLVHCSNCVGQLLLGFLVLGWSWA